MGWSSINLGLLHYVDFSINTRELILHVFDSASTALDDEHKKYQEYYNKNIGAAFERSESEGGLMFQEREWQEDLYRQRTQGVGALALDWLKFSLQEALDGAKKYLDKSHPPKPNYTGKSWLIRVANEYQDRFKIDFNNAPVSFDRIQEVVLARNAGVHRNDHVLQDYLDKIKKPVFVDDEDRFFVTKKALVDAIADCETFVKWVVKELENCSPTPAVKSTP
jgi:hypothetical protein